ncbi:hypothetical protein BH24DEI2_BH24DEI2_08790 [soil metagenome]
MGSGGDRELTVFSPLLLHSPPPYLCKKAQANLQIYNFPLTLPVLPLSE